MAYLKINGSLHVTGVNKRFLECYCGVRDVAEWSRYVYLNALSKEQVEKMGEDRWLFKHRGYFDDDLLVDCPTLDEMVDNLINPKAHDLSLQSVSNPDAFFYLCGLFPRLPYCSLNKHPFPTTKHNINVQVVRNDDGVTLLFDDKIVAPNITDEEYTERFIKPWWLIASTLFCGKGGHLFAYTSDDFGRRRKTFTYTHIGSDLVTSGADYDEVIRLVDSHPSAALPRFQFVHGDKNALLTIDIVNAPDAYDLESALRYAQSHEGTSLRVSFNDGFTYADYDEVESKGIESVAARHRRVLCTATPFTKR